MIDSTVSTRIGQVALRRRRAHSHTFERPDTASVIARILLRNITATG